MEPIQLLYVDVVGGFRDVSGRFRMVNVSMPSRVAANWRLSCSKKHTL